MASSKITPRAMNRSRISRLISPTKSEKCENPDVDLAVYLMDRSSQLRELVLKRVETEYKTLEDRISKNEEHCGQREKNLKMQEFFLEQKPEDKVERSNKHGVIFLNLKKIHSSKQKDCSKNTQLLNQCISPNTKCSKSVVKTKIYLNPNFKPTFQNDLIHRKENPAHISSENITVPKTSNLNNEIIKQKINSKNESNPLLSNEPHSSYSANKLQKIYVNKHFNELASKGTNYHSKIVQNKLNDDSAGTEISCRNLSTTSCLSRKYMEPRGVSIETNYRNKELSSEVLKKPKIQVEQDKKPKESVSLKNIKEYQPCNTMLEKVIFLNPKFRKKHVCSKTFDRSSIKNDVIAYESHTLQDKGFVNDCSNTFRKENTVKGNQKDVFSKSTTIQSLPHNGQSMTLHSKNTSGQRKRTASTCLVSISASKIIRRRKSNLKIESNIAGCSNKLLFLSKTKLVTRNILKKGTEKRNFVQNQLIKNDLSFKSKLTSSAIKNNLQLLTPNLLNTGKSLELITSNKGSNESVKPSNVTNTVNQPIFISKTKLVRTSVLEKGMDNEKALIKNIVESDTELKPKQKLVSPKSNLKYLTVHKIINQRKQNVLCSTNVSNKVYKPAFVTKIRSNNGKSLKLVKSNEIPQRYPKASTNEKYSTVLKRKQLMRQQMNKNIMCMLRNKSRKNQFSKINVSLKNITAQSPSCSKYVYKNKDTISKRQITKAAVLKRRGSCVKFQTSLSTDKSKHIKSKYNLIRKYSYYANSTALKENKSKPPSKLESRLKLKWRRQNTRKIQCKRKQLSIVNIGGVFYQCSRTSLTRNTALTRNKARPRQVLQKNKDGTILHIHGQKFKLERNGLTLTCLDKNPKRKRVDIGGVTFISSSSGTSLTRTNYHSARSFLVQAKQKSISLLTKKLKKNNEPCLFFHRFGKCSGKERGSCVRQHDPKNVAVCKKFVQGSCSDGQCLLSHTISSHNMPTCHHFLAGHCGRDHCLYPHIKVSDSAPICLDFLKGYCQLGGKCTKRHRDICPSFEKGVCSRGKYCPYPHPKSTSGKSLSRLTTLRKQKPSRDAELVSSSNLRYFDDVNLQKETMQEEEEQHVQLEDCASEEEEDKKLFRNRPKLGQLPSFIPLTD